MDCVVIISVAVLVIIAFVEGFCLFSKCDDDYLGLSFAAIVPIFCDDATFANRLNEISDNLRYSNPSLSNNIIIVNYSGSESQLETAKKFCLQIENAVIITPEELEKKLSEMFAINIKK